MKLWPFKKKQAGGSVSRNRYDRADVEASFLWTTPLVDWIHNTNDAMLLACTQHLLNCSSWPSWLPGKPESASAGHETDDGLVFTLFVCKVMRSMEGKCERLSPGLSHAVWMSGAFKEKYPDEYRGCRVSDAQGLVPPVSGEPNEVSPEQRGGEAETPSFEGARNGISNEFPCT